MCALKSDKNTIMKEGYSYAELLLLVGAILSTGTSVLLRGHPGVGKSSMAAELAQKMRLPLIDIRLAQRDPADIGGVYFPDHQTRQLELFPPGWVKRACDEPVFIFLDEINAAVTRLHQSVASQIVLEHRIGEFAFHPQTVVLAAGNLEVDNAIVTSLSSALCNRFAHFILRVDVDGWIDWGLRAGIYPNPVLHRFCRPGPCTATTAAWLSLRRAPGKWLPGCWACFHPTIPSAAWPPAWAPHRPRGFSRSCASTGRFPFGPSSKTEKR